MCRWLAPLFTYARLLVAARSYARNAKLPFDVRAFAAAGQMVTWYHGRMATWYHGPLVSWSPRLMVGCLDGRRDIAGILRRCLCEAFLPAIFH